jgi:predicted MFS family arabinose efflux permease
VAGPVVALAASLGLLIDAVTYLISFTLLRLIRKLDRRHEPPPSTEDTPPTSRWRELFAGGVEMWHAPVLRSLTTALCVMGIAAGATGALAVPFLLRTLHLPVSLFSLIFAASGAAGLVGSVVATRVVGRLPSVVLTAGAFACAAASAALLPMARGSLPVAAASAAAGIALPVFFGSIANVGLVGVMTTDVPEHVLGRVSATLQTVVTVAALTGALGGGALGDALGVRGALVVSAVVALVGLLFLAPLLWTQWTDWRRNRPVGPTDPADLADLADLAGPGELVEPLLTPESTPVPARVPG